MLIRDVADAPGAVAWVAPSGAAESSWVDGVQSHLRMLDPDWRVEAVDLEAWGAGKWEAVVAVDERVGVVLARGNDLIAVVDKSRDQMLFEPVFRASTLLEISVRGTGIRSKGKGQEQASKEPLLNVRLGRMRSQRYEELLRERFQELWGEQEGPAPAGEFPDVGRISYKTIRQSRLVQISAESPDPKVAALSANAAAEAALLYFMEENQKQIEAAVEWLEGVADTQKQELNKQNGALQAYRAEFQPEEGDVRLNKLKRERAAAAASLHGTLARIEQARLAADENTASLKLVERAVVPTVTVRRLLPGIAGVLVRTQGENGTEYEWVTP